MVCARPAIDLPEHRVSQLNRDVLECISRWIRDFRAERQPAVSRTAMGRVSEPGGLGGQVVLLRHARRAGRRGPVVRDRRLGVAGHLEQVGAHGVEPVVAGQPLVERRRAASRPAAGPWTMAAAIARLSATIGLSVIRSSSPYSARICGQSVSSTRAASSCTAAIAPAAGTRRPRPRGSALGDQRDPFGDQLAVPPRPVLLGQRDQLAAGPVRAGRRASVSSISASSPVDLAVVGQHARAASGSAGSPRRTARCGAGRRRCCWRSPR